MLCLKIACRAPLGRHDVPDSRCSTPRRGIFDVYRNDAADPHSLPDDHIVSLFEDRSGLLWIGTKFGGLAKWNPRTWSFGHRPARAPTKASRAATSWPSPKIAAGRTLGRRPSMAASPSSIRSSRPTTLRHEPESARNQRRSRDGAAHGRMTASSGRARCSGGLESHRSRDSIVSHGVPHNPTDPRSLSARPA